MAAGTIALGVALYYQSSSSGYSGYSEKPEVKRVRLSFVPKMDSVSNYEDCRALASDGTKWSSINGRWTKRRKSR